jgi:hypothetical protein
MAIRIQRERFVLVLHGLAPRPPAWNDVMITKARMADSRYRTAVPLQIRCNGPRVSLSVRVADPPE